MAVMDSVAWTRLYKGSTQAERSNTATLCLQGNYGYGCTKPNPKAGTIDLRIRINQSSSASHLVVLYRSGQRIGMHEVTVR